MSKIRIGQPELQHNQTVKNNPNHNNTHQLLYRSPFQVDEHGASFLRAQKFVAVRVVFIEQLVDFFSCVAEFT